MPRLTVNFKGKTLLSDTSLKLVSGRRYGLIGKVCFALTGHRERERESTAAEWLRVVV